MEEEEKSVPKVVIPSKMTAPPKLNQQEKDDLKKAYLNNDPKTETGTKMNNEQAQDFWKTFNV